MTEAANKPDSAALQAPISERLDRVLACMVADGLAPRAIYLTPADYDELAARDTRLHREATGSTALLWPLSYADVPIIAEHMIDKVEIPVRQRTGNLRSAVYSSTGACILLAFADLL